MRAFGYGGAKRQKPPQERDKSRQIKKTKRKEKPPANEKGKHWHRKSILKYSKHRQGYSNKVNPLLSALFKQAFKESFKIDLFLKALFSTI